MVGIKIAINSNTCLYIGRVLQFSWMFTRNVFNIFFNIKYCYDLVWLWLDSVCFSSDDIKVDIFLNFKRCFS